jgi:hypothetical protein
MDNRRHKPRDKKSQKRNIADSLRDGPRNQQEPVFLYLSQCCNSPAKKKPCERSKDDRRERKFSKSGLGHWRCIECSKACKVKRVKPNKEDQNKKEAA